MNLMEQAMNDIREITSNMGEFAVSITLESPTGVIVETQGIYSDITNMYDENGYPINGKKSHVSFSELPLIAQNYPTRNQDGLISFTGHLVTINYADGSSKRYMVDDCRPDYSINLITVYLSEYA
jgi:hypothetical protein